MDDLISFRKKSSYNDFKNQCPSLIRLLLDSLRNYCFLLGDNIVEDVRMHRIVFCKSFTFRWFLDIEPKHDSILLKIQRNRREPQKTMEIKPNENLEKIKEIIRDAFNTIR